jgi:hypothetical protein
MFEMSIHPKEKDRERKVVKRQKEWERKNDSEG